MKIRDRVKELRRVRADELLPSPRNWRTGTFNTANEQTARDIDSSSSNDYTLTYDAVGNLTDDGVDYDYVYDWMGRLRKVKTQGGALVAEYWYNGLNHRLSWHYDNTRSGGGAPDGTTDSNDKKYHFAYDTRWRIVAVFRESDTAPKERFVWHNAGMNGTGGSSYIDACVLRDRDINSGWTASGDGTLEERVYYAQNWRADVSVVLSDTGKVKEWVKYSSYGVPFSITPADFNGDGFVNGNDDDDFDAAYNGGAGAWDARVDLDLDGTLDSDDDTLFTSEFVAGEAGGYRVLSRASVANRLGYAGYQHAPELAKTRWHVRHRVLDSETGRWLRRDPLGYIDGPSLFSYVRDNPLRFADPTGTASNISHCLTCCGPPPCCNDCSGSDDDKGVSCACCAESLVGTGDSYYFGFLWGHALTVTMELKYVAQPRFAKDCWFEWWEKADVLPAEYTERGLKPNEWIKVNKEFPESPVFSGWGLRTAKCPGKDSVSMIDHPAIWLDDASSMSRTACFAIRVHSGGGSSVCSKAAHTVYFRQYLTQSFGYGGAQDLEVSYAPISDYCGSPPG